MFHGYHRAVFCIVFLALTAGLSAAAEFPYVAEVTREGAHIRCGPADAWKELCTVKLGDRLVAFEEQVGWLRVRPPEGLTCWISTKYVKKMEDGSGFVIGEKVNLRITPDADPTTAVYPIGRASSGDRVNILEEVSGWYRIQAYDKVTCWIKKEWAKYVEPYTSAAQERMDEEAAKLHTDKARQLALRKKFFETEELVRKEYARPVVEQDFTQMIAAYDEIAKEVTVREIRESAQQRFDHLSARQKAIVELRSLIEEKDTALKEAEGKLIERLEEDAKAAQKREFVAQGWLEGVGKIIGRPGSHKLVQGGRILYFLKSDKIDMNTYLGKLVGIRGVVQEAPGWDWKVIHVDEIEDLTPR
ncbi:MAG: SH3 domain-containing protein [Planctomycetota bacterium]|nr:SH3 domain-containing protein [Planctomycetota bacterium]